MKRTHYLILLLVFGIGLTFLWLNLISFGPVVDKIAHVDVLVVILALGFYVLSQVIRSYRWKLILNSVKKVRFRVVFKTYLFGNFVNFLVPVRLGELAKSLVLKQTDKVRVSQSLPTVIIDKVADLFPIIPLIAAMLLISVKFNQAVWILSTLVLVSFIILTLIFIFSTKYSKELTNLMIFFIPGKFKSNAREFIERFLKGFSIVHGWTWLAIAALTIVAVLSDGTYFFLLFIAFGYPASFWVILLGYTLFVLSFILPTPPAQIGSSEVILLVVFSAIFGIEKNLVSAVSIIAHALTGIIIIITGLYAAYSLGIKTTSIIRKK